MRAKKLPRMLALNKVTVTNLDTNLMRTVHGGKGIETLIDPTTLVDPMISDCATYCNCPVSETPRCNDTTIVTMVSDHFTDCYCTTTNFQFVEEDLVE